ncbi:g6780 [Coccomyxa elongata]
MRSWNIGHFLDLRWVTSSAFCLAEGLVTPVYKCRGQQTAWAKPTYLPLMICCGSQALSSGMSSGACVCYGFNMRSQRL